MVVNKAHVLLACSEPMGDLVAGIGIRYIEMARYLRSLGYAVRILAPSRSSPPPKMIEDFDYIPFDGPQSIADALHSVHAAVVQGPVGTLIAEQCAADFPLAVDLYDPWLIENLSYEHLGPEVLERDLRDWKSQMRRGDFFMVSTEEQRRYFLGFLTAMGRLTARGFANDRGFRGLIDTVPFAAGTPPTYSPWLGDEVPRPRLLFGALYDWMDPIAVLRAMEGGDHSWQILFHRTPNSETTPDAIEKRTQRWCLERQWIGSRAHFLPWVPYARRFDLLRDVDLLIVAHQGGLEEELSLRTRIIEAVACGVPVVSHRGGPASDALQRTGAGLVVDCTDPVALAEAIKRALNEAVKRECRKTFLAPFHPEKAFYPLARFLDSTRNFRHVTA